MRRFGNFIYSSVFARTGCPLVLVWLTKSFWGVLKPCLVLVVVELNAA